MNTTGAVADTERATVTLPADTWLVVFRALVGEALARAKEGNGEKAAEIMNDVLPAVREAAGGSDLIQALETEIREEIGI